jgi:hypothetical protein
MSQMTRRASIRLLVFIALPFVGGCGRLSLEQQLIIASQHGNIPEIKRLLALGVNVNCRDPSLDGGTPLIWAVRQRREEAVEVLLAAGADPNIRTGTGQSALFFAIGDPLEDRSRTIEALVLGGANTEEYKKLFESLPRNDLNRVAFEQAIALKNQCTTNRP